MGIDPPNVADVTDHEYRKDHRMTSHLDEIPIGTAETPIPSGLWRVDPQRSEIGFAVKAMWGLQTVRGVFRAYDGSLEVREGAAVGELTIEAASLDTGHKRRDKHLRSHDFFDVERHPRIEFIATAVAGRDGVVTVTGELAIASSRVRLEIPVTVEQTDDGTVHLSGETTVPRTAAGLGWNWLGTISPEAVLHARLELRRRGSEVTTRRADGVR
jgi:polyisoprenoid-binding protein YceI